MKLNKYQKIVLLLYVIAFIYFTILHVPFKILRGSEILYDTLLSNKANIDFSRLILVIIIVSLISGILFSVVRKLRMDFKLRSRLKLKTFFYFLIGIFFIAVSVFLVNQEYGKSFSSNKTAKKMDSTSLIVKTDNKIQTSLPILDTSSQIDIPPFLKNKYLYNGKIFSFSEVFNAAKQSNLDIDTYINKAGIIIVDQEGLPIPKTILKKYKTPNGKIVDGSVLLKKYGSRFYKLVDNGTLKVYDEKE